MSKDIKVGDLVMIIKPTPCCGSTKTIGMVLTVISGKIHTFSKCGYCGIITHEDDEVLLSNNKTIERGRLIKIDPPSLPETITKDEELTA